MDFRRPVADLKTKFLSRCLVATVRQTIVESERRFQCPLARFPPCGWAPVAPSVLRHAATDRIVALISTTATPHDDDRRDADRQTEPELQRFADCRRVDVVSLDRLTHAERRCWQAFRSADQNYRSPFFSLAFADAVHRVRGDVEVVVVRDGGVPTALLPLHRVGGHGYPVGRFFNDAHNLISAGDTPVTWNELIGPAQLNVFDFHALTGASEGDFPPWTCHRRVRSFRCDIGSDPSGYLKELGRDHKTIGRQPQKTRKLHREVGPVSFEFDCRDIGLLRRTIDLKRRQYRRTHILDLFSPRWTVRLLEELFKSNEPDGGSNDQARGVLSVLRAGDRVVALHYGILEAGLLHYWFPVYDPAFARYSPGTALFRSLLETAGEHGLTCIDMGYGEQPYKVKQTDSTGWVLQGCIAPSRLYRHYRTARWQVVNTAKKLPGKEPMKKLCRRFWPDAGISKLR